MKEVLPIKLELENYYVEHESLLYDIQLIWRTIVIILQVLCKKKDFKEQPELAVIEGEYTNGVRL